MSHASVSQSIGKAALTTGISRATRYVPPVGPMLRGVLYLIFAAFAVLGATGAYLAAISFLNWSDPSRLFTTPFTFWMLLVHCAVGVFGVLPFLIFGVAHLLTAWKRTNRVAIRLGLALFTLGLVVSGTGLALFRLEGVPQLQTGRLARLFIYVAHVAVPFLAVYVYVAHRKAGPKIRWRWAKFWAGGVSVFVAGACVLALLHSYRLPPPSTPRTGAQFLPPRG